MLDACLPREKTSDLKAVCVLGLSVMSDPLGTPMDCRPLGSSVHGISQIRILEPVAISHSKDLRNPGIEPSLRHPLPWQVDSLPLSHLENGLEG